MLITLSLEEIEAAICEYMERKDICPGDGPAPLEFIFGHNEGLGHMIAVAVDQVEVSVK